MAFNQDDLIDILNLAQLPDDQRKEVLRIAKMLEDEKKKERENEPKVPKVKGQYVVVLKTASPLDTSDIAASVFVIPDEEDPTTVFDRLRTAAVDSNVAKKTKKKNLLTTFTDVLEFLKPKFAKGQDMKVLTKEMVWCHNITSEMDEKFIPIPKGEKED